MQYNIPMYFTLRKSHANEMHKFALDLRSLSIFSQTNYLVDIVAYILIRIGVQDLVKANIFNIDFKGRVTWPNALFPATFLELI